MSSDSRKRVVLVGQGPTAHSAFQSLAERFDVVAVLRAAAEGDDLVAEAGASGVPVETDTSVQSLIRLIDGADPDAVVVSSYDRILPADLVSARPFINVHYAPLPQYRGRAVVNWAIINGESHAAISIHCLEPELDAGGILLQQQVPIGPRDTVTDLYARLNAIQRDTLAECVDRRLGGDRGTAQDEARASYACTRLPVDGEIDWHGSTASVDRLIRALTPPYPGAYTWLGLDRIVVHAAEPVTTAPEYAGRVPGRVVSVDRTAGTSDVLTADGVVRLRRVSREGGPEVPAAEVFSSVKMTAGLSTGDLVAELRELRSRLDRVGP